MGDEPKKPKVEDHTVEVSTDALRALRESAQHKVARPETPPGSDALRPKLRTLPGLGGSSAPDSTPAPDIRGVLEQASRMSAAPEEAGETKAIRRDNLVELLKGEIKEANAADDAPSVGILRHTRAKGDTPQQLLAQSRLRSNTPISGDMTLGRSAQGQKTRTDLDEIARALNGMDDDPSESTREVRVIPELRAERQPQQTPDPRAGQDPTVAADAISKQQLASLLRSTEDGGATRELGSMPDLLKLARGSGSFEALPSDKTVARPKHESPDYSLEEFTPGQQLEEESAASLHLSPHSEQQLSLEEESAASLHLSPEQGSDSSLVVALPPAASDRQVAASTKPAPVEHEPQVEPAQPLVASAQAADAALEPAAPRNGLVGRILMFGVGACVALMGLASAFSETIAEEQLGLIIAAAGVLVMALALFLRRV